MRCAALVVVLVASTACYAPSFRDCALACSSAGTCPDGLACVAGLCRAGGESEPCAPRGDGGSEGIVDDGPPADASTITFEPPVLVDLGPGVWTEPCVSEDQTLLYVVEAGRILRSSYDGAAWLPPEPVGGLMPPVGTMDMAPMLLPQGTGIYFASDRNSTMNKADIFFAPRVGGNMFGSEALVPHLSVASSNDTGGSFTGDGARAVITSDRNGNLDLFESVAAGSPMTLAPLNSVLAESHASLTADGLLVVFASNRGGNYDIYLSTRETVAAPFAPPGKIGGLDTSLHETDPWITGDGRTIYFSRSSAASGRQIFRATRSP